MFGSFRWFILAVPLLTLSAVSLDQPSVPDLNTTCNFDSSKQLDVDYSRFELAPKKKAFGNSVPYGKVWAPGGKPLTLFANTRFTVGGKDISDGAYTMFIVPEEKSWTLVISKSTDTSGKYNEAQDLARIPMEFGKLPQAEPAFTAYFAHVAPDECNLRLDLENARAWVAFKLK
jgi:Protein of unknown function (DUF2911)